jgi:hypothetical protein
MAKNFFLWKGDKFQNTRHGSYQNLLLFCNATGIPPPPPMFAVSKLNPVMFHSQRFVFEACQDLTLVILMVAAAISLTLGMTTEVLYYIIYYWTASSFYPSPGSFVLKTLVLY